jgi:uncharacterized delta-60 repeat protein
MLRPFGEIARTHTYQTAVLALGIAFTFTVACADPADLRSRDAGSDAATPGEPDSGPDTGATHSDAAADSGPADAGNDGAAWGPRGSLDPSFGAGVVTLGAVAPAFLGPHGVAVQPNGAIVYAGEYQATSQTFELLAGRVLADGSVDNSFNGIGHFTNEQNGYWDEVGCVLALVPGGGIQIDGFIDPNIETNHEMFTVRLTASGQLDSTFGGGSGFLAIADNNVDSKANDVLVQPDGHVLLAGFQGSAGAIARLATDGTLDTTWGIPNDSGSVGAALYPSLGDIMRLQQLKSGDVLAAPGGPNFVVAALTPSGTFDTNYGTGGVATVTLPTPLTGAPDMVALDDGSVVCVASTATTIELVRLDPHGKLDTSFGQTAGRTSVPSSLTATSLVMLPDGTFAVAAVNPDNIVGVARFTAMGRLDTSFGGGSGIKTVPLAVNNDASLAVDGSGRLVIGAGTDKGVVIARMFP